MNPKPMDLMVLKGKCLLDRRICRERCLLDRRICREKAKWIFPGAAARREWEDLPEDPEGL